MSAIERLRDEFRDWMGQAAQGIASGFDRLRVRRDVTVVEDARDHFVMSVVARKGQAPLADHAFVLTDGEPVPDLPQAWRDVLAGCRLDWRLQPWRCLLRPLDLPRQAAEFLDGMVRAQIDRLTPWSPADAVFGWSPAEEIAGGRIRLMIAAASRNSVQPLLRFAEDCDVGALTLAVENGAPSDPSAAVIRLVQRRFAGALDVDRLRGVLAAVLIAVTIAAAAAWVGGEVVGGRLAAEEALLTRQIAERRAAMRLSTASADGGAQSALARRKQSTPSSALVIEALSEVLPDDTFVTELRIEKDRMQIVGMTQDAPSLVKLLEQSPHFTRAIFFAPTTRGPTDAGERFHVEARIKPYFGGRS